MSKLSDLSAAVVVAHARNSRLAGERLARAKGAGIKGDLALSLYASGLQEGSARGALVDALCGNGFGTYTAESVAVAAATNGARARRSGAAPTEATVLRDVGAFIQPRLEECAPFATIAIERDMFERTVTVRRRTVDELLDLAANARRKRRAAGEKTTDLDEAVAELRSKPAKVRKPVEQVAPVAETSDKVA